MCKCARMRQVLSERMNKNEKENQKVINRTVTSVVVYAVFSVLLKLPSALFALLSAIHFDQNPYSKSTENKIQLFFENVCIRLEFCGFLNTLALFLYSVSLSTSIFFFVSFDKKFHLAVRIAKSKLFSSKEVHKKFLEDLEKPNVAKKRRN